MKTACYLLWCESRAVYVGITGDLERRMYEHFRGQGSFYTGHYRPLEVLGVTWFKCRGKAEWMEAVATAGLRERHLKVGGGNYTRVTPSGRGKHWEGEDLKIRQMINKLGRKLVVNAACNAR